jgi:hypothetical protein
MVVALLALCVATSGTAIAASKLAKGDKLIAKHSLSGNRLRSHTLTGKQVNLNKLGKVPSATNADHATTADFATKATSATNASNATHASDASTVGGQLPSAFFPSSKVRTFDVKLSFGQTETLFSAGTLTFSAKCVKNGTDPSGTTGQDVSELLVATSQNGGILTTGNGEGLHGTSPSDFLDTDTSEVDRAVAWDSTTTGTSYGAIENDQDGYGMDVVDPNGVTVIFPDGLTAAVNLFGSNCLMAGFAIIP